MFSLGRGAVPICGLKNGLPDNPVKAVLFSATQAKSPPETVPNLCVRWGLSVTRRSGGHFGGEISDFLLDAFTHDEDFEMLNRSALFF